ncbi:MAG TPA: hypothetical protein VIO60_01000 [Rectinemataceae bacterium]
MNTKNNPVLRAASCLLICLVSLGSCRLFSDEHSKTEEPGASVEVELGGLAGSSEGAKALASDLTVTVRVFNKIYRTQIGSDATLAWDAGSQRYKGRITIPDTLGEIYVLAFGVNAQGQHVARAAANPTITTGTSTLNLVAEASYTPGDGLTGLGPAGGQVFWDKGSYSDGWRYLEVAPTRSDHEWDYSWGGMGTRINSDADDLTDGDIGSGSVNTARIIAALGTSSNIAAKYAVELVWNGIDDWFLPSWRELEKMHEKCMALVRPPNTSDYYWSSTENGKEYAQIVCFDGTWSPWNGSWQKSGTRYVRAARDF